MKVHVDQRQVVRRSTREDYVQAMREGRRQRAATFVSAKTYRRKPKHKQEDDA